MKSYYFEFDGKKSFDMGFSNVRTSNSDAKRELIGKHRISTTRLLNGRMSFIKGIEKEPLTFSLTIMPEDGGPWTEELFKRLVSWLVTDDYKPFVSGDNPSAICYAKCVSDLNWQGYYDYGTIDLEFETNGNGFFTRPAYVSYTVEGEKTFFLNNSSVPNQVNYPQIEITKRGSAGKVELVNHTENDRTTSLSQVNKDEKIVLDNEYHLIQSETPFDFYGERFNKTWFRLLPGNNKITVKGDCEITFELEFETI